MIKEVSDSPRFRYTPIWYQCGMFSRGAPAGAGDGML